MVIGEQASSFGPATLIRKLKEDLPQFPWLAEGSGNPNNKVDMPDHVKAILAQPTAPKREAESPERTERIRGRMEQAAADAQALKGMLAGGEDASAWWRTNPNTPAGGRAVTSDAPLTVLVAGGGLAGLVSAAACHAKGMKVAIFEQASSYAPYGGPIQIQSNALRAIQRINPTCYEELVKAGTVTADRVSGLKIGYKKGNKLAGLYDRGDWLVRFDTIGPALEAGLPATVVVDRPVIQQILVKHGFPEGVPPAAAFCRRRRLRLPPSASTFCLHLHPPASAALLLCQPALPSAPPSPTPPSSTAAPGTVRIQSRIESYEDLGDGRGVVATLSDGTK